MISLALKYLIAKKRQSLFTLLGVLLGAGGYVSISGFFVGFQNFILDQLINNSAHIFIQYRQELLSKASLDKIFFGDAYEKIFWSSAPAGRKDYARIENPQSWYQRLEKDPRVLAYSPQMTVPALLSKAKASVSVNLVGCMPEKQAKVTNLASKMTEGKFTDIGAGGNRLVVGKELLKQLGAKVSQNINVSVGVRSAVPFKIVGVFETGNRFSDLQAFGALADIQKVNGTSNQVNAIDVKLIDYQMASQLATSWSQISPEKIESWDQRNSSFFSMIRVQTTMRYLVVGVVMLVAGFGIYNVLMMTVNHKMKDVAILRAMGYESLDILLLFLYQGLILGISGAIMGCLIGYLVCLYLQTLKMPGPPGITTTGEHLHISLSMAIYVQASLLAILGSTFASFLPARTASRLTPIEIIRGGVE